MTKISNLVVLTILLSFFTTTAVVPVARAAVIGTTSYIDQVDQLSRDEIKNIFAREDVRDQLISYGVDPDAAAMRIAAMSDEELRAIQGNIADLPAGSGVLAILGVVLIVLIVLELLGVTNVFNKL